MNYIMMMKPGCRTLAALRSPCPASWSLIRLGQPQLTSRAPCSWPSSSYALCQSQASGKLLRELSNFQPCMADILHFFTYRGAQISSSEYFQATVTARAQPSGIGGVCGRWQAPASGWQPAAASQRAIAHACIQSAGARTWLKSWSDLPYANIPKGWSWPLRFK